MADTTGYTSESDILDSFVYNLLPMFLFTMNFLDDTWNYNSSTGGRIFDDAIFIGTPFIATLVLIWVKNSKIIWLNIFYTTCLFFVIVFFISTRVWLNHGKLKIGYVYEKLTWKVWIHRILCFLVASQTILIIFILTFMYKFLPEESLTKTDYKYYIWVFFPCLVAISYLIIQSLIFYREGEKNEKNNKNEGNEEYKKNEEVKEDVKNDNEENIDKNKKRNKEFIEIITRFIIWSILHGIVVTELWLFPINAYITKFYLLLYINCVALIFRYDSPEGIKFGIGFLNFIFIVNSNSLKEEFHLPVENFYFLGKNGSKDKVHNDRFKNIRNLYMK
ncbi:hypothetical protein RclHR1_09800007 [Rhizophagus clarus]|uniref:Uncharacterized protein n=1 Tax=Rhizophagus clarus TaxID=94130 RepID=A0A2Z6SBF8_9GLOM|nr:hypothetical protein RclHR1_09800007 [Rhizophagus clarus]